MKMSGIQLVSLTCVPSEEVFLQTCYLMSVECVVIIHRAMFARHIYMTCSLHGVQLGSIVGETELFPQLHISISKCQTFMQVPLYVSLTHAYGPRLTLYFSY